MIDDLEREGLIKKLPIDRKKTRDAMALAHRDVKNFPGDSCKRS
jgi:hypothetical protein